MSERKTTSQPATLINVPNPLQPKVKPYRTNQTISHLSLPVSNLEKSIVFYDQLLATLGFKRLLTLQETAGYGTFMSYGFWIGKCHTSGEFKKTKDGENRFPGIHVCFNAPSRKVSSSILLFLRFDEPLLSGG
jgi:catechol 2,3-dioxygenase-like lactoylglutathione lyase family enzyme